MMKDNYSLQELAGFNTNLTRDMYGIKSTDPYDSIDIADLVDPGSIGDTEISNLSYSKVEDIPDPYVSIQGWTSDIAFQSTDYNTLSWAGGIITLANGDTFTISSGNTGDITDVTYIYLDTDVSTTILQKSTVASNSVGENKILIAVCEDNTDDEKNVIFQVFGGQGGMSPLITGDNIVASTISGNELIANTITTREVYVEYLSALSANIGEITSGKITGTIVQSALTGYRTRLSSAGLQFLYGDTVKGSIYTSSAGDITIKGNDDVILNADGSDKAQFGGSGLKPLSSGYDLGADATANRFDVAYLNKVYLGGSWNISQSGDQLYFKYGSTLKMMLNNGKIRPADTYESSDGTDGVSEEFEVATSFNESGGDYYWKARLLTFKDGILTNKGSESDWRKIT